MSTASKLHRKVILKHRAERKPIYELWTKIWDSHQSHDYSVYVYWRGDVGIFYVDDLLLASNSSAALKKVKVDLAAHFTIHDQGPITSILGIKVERDRGARTISLSQPGYIQSILNEFNMTRFPRQWKKTPGYPSVCGRMTLSGGHRWLGCPIANLSGNSSISLWLRGPTSRMRSVYCAVLGRTWARSTGVLQIAFCIT